MKTVSDLGEFRLIEDIKKGLCQRAEIIKGIGDDCAIMRPAGKKDLVVTTDMICEGTHFTQDDVARPGLIGRKAMAVNISDMAACGGEAVAAFVSMSMPASFPSKTFRSIYRGIKIIAHRYNISIAGGDISQSEKIVIAITLIGWVSRTKAILRSDAKIGDAIFVTGSFGRQDKWHHLTFTPRIREARALVENFTIHAMIDVSDGLISDLGHILKESCLGARVYLDRIPIACSPRMLKRALTGGEDFELLFTLSKSEARRLEKEKKKLFRTRLTRIGEITQSKFYLVDATGRKESPSSYQGYNHFHEN